MKIKKILRNIWKYYQEYWEAQAIIYMSMSDYDYKDKSDSFTNGEFDLSKNDESELSDNKKS